VKIMPVLLRKDWLVQALPIFAAMLLAALVSQPTSSETSWLSFAQKLGCLGSAMIPLLLSHIAACRLPTTAACLIWCAGFMLYPGILHLFGMEGILPIKCLALAIGFSLLFLLLHPQARGASGGQVNAVPPINRLPITLDGTIAVLFALWVLVTTSLFASTADAVRNQPLQVWLDIDRIASHPGETIWYLCQFAFVGLLLFGWYWACRYFLIRRIMHQQGIVPFGFAVIILLAIATPIVAGAILLLPINITEWTLLPSENHNPFDPINYRFTFWLTAVLLPLILVIERLLAERGEASERHEAVRAEMHLLQQQINPHFLFNTLNTLYSLCLRDRAESAEAVVKLSDLLRYVVYQGQTERASLDDEIDYLKNYLDLQMLRFGHRCQLDCVWPENAASYTLPPLLLIMLVENVFKHGVEPIEGTCDVRICLIITDKRLQFECLNPVSSSIGAVKSGLGLANLRRRLELIYRANFLLEYGPVGNSWRSRLELDLSEC
jgi:Histidine kinase